MNSSDSKDGASLRAAYLAGIVYAVITFSICLRKYYFFGYSDFDLAVHTQSMWNIIHGSGDCSILGIPFLGNHMVLILYLLAPLFAIFPSAVFLLAVQSLTLGAGAVGVYKAARLELSGRVSLIFAMAYLLYPPLIYMNLYEFHPVALASTFLIFCILEFRRNNFPRFMIWLLLAMACQENISLIAAGFGILAAAYRRGSKWIYVPLITGLLYFFLAAGVVMPKLNRNVISFLSLYSHFGSTPSEIVSSIIMHPLHTLSVMFSAQKLWFLVSLLMPAAFLSLLAPRTLIPLLPVLAQRLLSCRGSEHSILFHYQAEFIPFVFLAAVSGYAYLASSQSSRLRLTARALLLSAPLVAFFSSGIVGAIRGQVSKSSGETSLAAYKTIVAASIPQDSRTACTFDFLPVLACRNELHSIHHIYTGYYTLSNVRYPPPSDIDSVIIDTNDPLTFGAAGFYDRNGHTNLQALLGQGLSVFSTEKSVTYYSRAKPSEFNYIAITDSLVPNHADAAPIVLLGTKVWQLPDGRMALETAWVKSSEGLPEHDFRADISDAEGNVLFNGILSPGNRIHPVQTWPAGRMVLCRHLITPASKGNIGKPVVKITAFPLSGGVK